MVHVVDMALVVGMCKVVIENTCKELQVSYHGEEQYTNSLTYRTQRFFGHPIDHQIGVPCSEDGQFDASGRMDLGGVLWAIKADLTALTKHKDTCGRLHKRVIVSNLRATCTRAAFAGYADIRIHFLIFYIPHVAPCPP